MASLADPGQKNKDREGAPDLPKNTEDPFEEAEVESAGTEPGVEGCVNDKIALGVQKAYEPPTELWGWEQEDDDDLEAEGKAMEKVDKERCSA